MQSFFFIWSKFFLLKSEMCKAVFFVEVETGRPKVLFACDINFQTVKKFNELLNNKKSLRLQKTLLTFEVQQVPRMTNTSEYRRQGYLWFVYISRDQDNDHLKLYWEVQLLDLITLRFPQEYFELKTRFGENFRLRGSIGLLLFSLPAFSWGLRGQQLEIKPPHFTVFHHIHHFARVKS